MESSAGGPLRTATQVLWQGSEAAGRPQVTTADRPVAASSSVFVRWWAGAWPVWCAAELQVVGEGVLRKASEHYTAKLECRAPLDHHCKLGR